MSDQPRMPTSSDEPDDVEQLADHFGSTDTGKLFKGCGPLLLVGAVFIAVIIGMLGIRGDWWAGDDEGACTTAAGPIGTADSCPTPTASASATDEPTEEASEEPPTEDAPEDGDPITSADLPDDGVGLPGDLFEPPAEEDLPAGAVLYTGSSGDQIGCITCDGGSRFLSIERPGVVVGNDGMTSQATTWKESGTILEFGANVSGPNRGRYGFNLFSGPTTYFNGCSMEIGSRSCLQARPGPLEKGTPVVIIIGEGGTMKGGKPASTGDFTVDWWFVFQPD